MAKKNAPKKEQLGGDALRRKLREDDTFLKYRRILKNILTKMDEESFYQEIQTMHAGRSIRNLYGTTPSSDKLNNAVAQDVRCRSRLVEMILKATRHHDMLDIVLDETRKYLAAKYSEEVSDLRTKGERQTYFDTYLTSGITTKRHLTSMIEAANMVVKDIDQANFSTNHLTKILELVLAKNNDR